MSKEKEMKTVGRCSGCWDMVFFFWDWTTPSHWLSGLGRLGKLARALACPCRTFSHCESHSPLVLQRTHLPNRETMWRNEGAFVNVAHWRDNIKKFFKTKGVILRFHIIRQVYDLSVCEGADGASHTAICLKLAHLSQGISIVLSSPSTLPCLGLLWCSREYTQKPLGQLALLALQHLYVENASAWTSLYVTLCSELATSNRNPCYRHCGCWNICRGLFLHKYWLTANLCTLPEG